MRRPTKNKTHTSAQREYLNLLIKIDSCKTEEDYTIMTNKIEYYKAIYKDINYYNKLMHSLSGKMTKCLEN